MKRIIALLLAALLLLLPVICCAEQTGYLRKTSVQSDSTKNVDFALMGARKKSHLKFLLWKLE